jgi:hypothetical protein
MGEPDIVIHHAIQDDMPGTLDTVSIAFYVGAGSGVPRGTLEADSSEKGKQE